MKKILIISNNDSIISLFDEYTKNTGKLEVVNRKPFIPFKGVIESVEEIKNTNFDVLMMGHKLKKIDYELLYSGYGKSEDGEGLEILKSSKNFLKGKTIISDGCTPVGYRKIMNLYRGAGVNHFINRNTVNFADRFNNLILCLN